MKLQEEMMRDQWRGASGGYRSILHRKPASVTRKACSEETPPAVANALIEQLSLWKHSRKQDFPIAKNSRPKQGVRGPHLPVIVVHPIADLVPGESMVDAVATAPQPASPHFMRQVLTILAADVVGYARLTEAAEEETHERLRSLRVGLIDPCMVSYRGRIVKNTGDGFLAVFDSAVDAIHCAIELQREISDVERTRAPDRKIIFRMGLNVAPTIVESEDVYGMGVNIAARLEQYAPPGGILVSSDILERARSPIDVPMEDLGPLRLKNMSQPVRAYSLLVPGVDRIAAARRTHVARRAKLPSVAVLPFHAAGDGADDGYFGDGIVEDIIVALQSIRGLLVIARSSTLSFRSIPVDPRRVGQELGVRYVLSGSVRRTDKQLRIVVELADVEAGSVIWADRYDGELAELFDFQARIATRIVWSVAPHVREAELKRALRKRPSNLNAYDFVMQAIDLMYRMNFADFTQAGALLQNAIAADENYATAYAYAALWHLHNVVQGWAGENGPDRIEALRLSASAIDRDPADGFALAVHAHIRSMLFREYEAAISLFDRALDASPGNAMVWSLSSGAYSYMGDGRTGLERAQHGLRLSPVDTQAFFYLTFLSVAHYVNSTFDEAAIWARKCLGFNPRLCATLRLLTVSLVAMGERDEAREVGQMLLKIQPRFQISTYAGLCPYRMDVRTDFLARLREAGLPE
jgi:adenylate cyclase